MSSQNTPETCLTEKSSEFLSDSVLPVPFKVDTSPSDMLSSQLAGSRFQQQLTGQWNDKVLRNEKYGNANSNSFSYTSDVPQELGLDLQNPFRVATDEINSVKDISENNLTMDVLKEFDRDYLELRSRLVNLINNLSPAITNGDRPKNSTTLEIPEIITSGGSFSDDIR